MITSPGAALFPGAAPRQLPEQVLRAWLTADKDRTSVLRASAAWMSADYPADAILTEARP